VLDKFIRQNPDHWILVTDELGYNMSGFMICAYLVECHDLCVDDALYFFSEAQKPGLFDILLVNLLRERYCSEEERQEMEQLSSWPKQLAKPNWYHGNGATTTTTTMAPSTLDDEDSCVDNDDDVPPLSKPNSTIGDKPLEPMPTGRKRNLVTARNSDVMKDTTITPSHDQLITDVSLPSSSSSSFSNVSSFGKSSAFDEDDIEDHESTSRAPPSLGSASTNNSAFDDGDDVMIEEPTLSSSHSNDNQDKPKPDNMKLGGGDSGHRTTVCEMPLPLKEAHPYLQMVDTAKDITRLTTFALQLSKKMDYFQSIHNRPLTINANTLMNVATTHRITWLSREGVFFIDPLYVKSTMLGGVYHVPNCVFLGKASLPVDGTLLCGELIVDKVSPNQSHPRFLITDALACQSTCLEKFAHDARLKMVEVCCIFFLFPYALHFRVKDMYGVKEGVCEKLTKMIKTS
ncbi:hypothetical protein RFI_21067, partial [Reticulomyxa filosa]